MNEAIKKLVEAIKVRIAFIGMPTEPMNEAGPDWSKEVKQMDSLLALLRDEPDGWIPVSERLPERTGEYLVYPTAKHCPTLWYQKGWYWYSHQDDSIQETVGYCEDPILEVTHWKPIVLPKQEKGDSDVFITQEERVAAYHKSIGDKWDGEHWVSDNQMPIVLPKPDCPPKEPGMCDGCGYVSACAVLPHLPCADKMAVEEPKPDEGEADEFFPDRLRSVAVACEFDCEAAPPKLLNKAAARIEALVEADKSTQALIKILQAENRGMETLIAEQVRQIAELQAKKEAE